MLTKYHKQVIEEIFEEMVDLDVNSEEYKELYNEMLEYLKKEDFDKIKDEFVDYSTFQEVPSNESFSSFVERTGVCNELPLSPASAMWWYWFVFQESERLQDGGGLGSQGW